MLQCRDETCVEIAIRLLCGLRVSLVAALLAYLGAFLINIPTKKKPKFKECITKATDTKPWLIVYRRTYNFVTVRIGIVIYIGRFVVEGILISKA